MVSSCPMVGSSSPDGHVGPGAGIRDRKRCGKRPPVFRPQRAWHSRDAEATLATSRPPGSPASHVPSWRHQDSLILRKSWCPQEWLRSGPRSLCLTQDLFCPRAPALSLGLPCLHRAVLHLVCSWSPLRREPQLGPKGLLLPPLLVSHCPVCVSLAAPNRGARN